jgi:hypothetical protein
MEQSSSWEVDCRSAGQEISSLLWTLKFHYRVHTTPDTGPYMNHIN